MGDTPMALVPYDGQPDGTITRYFKRAKFIHNVAAPPAAAAASVLWQYLRNNWAQMPQAYNDGARAWRWATGHIYNESTRRKIPGGRLTSRGYTPYRFKQRRSYRGRYSGKYSYRRRWNRRYA